MADDWTQALQEHADGLLVQVEVVPNAQSPGFPIGYNPWRRRLQGRVRAPPEDGKANDELCDLVATFFALPRSQVSVAQGATSRQKQMLLRTSDADAVRRRVQEAWR